VIPEEVRTEIIDRTDLVALIGRTVVLKKAGTLFKGCCPFHNERTPSFTVSPVRRTYHCFGCGVHGDAVRFVMETQALSYPEALRQLASECGVTIPETRSETAAEREARTRKKSEAERLLHLQDKVAAFYSDALFRPEGTAGRAYLRERRVGRAAAAAFRLGWASGDKAAFDAFVRSQGFSLEDLALVGLVVAPDTGWQRDAPLGGGHLRFRQRVMFPVLDLRGEVVGFGGRVVEKDAKIAKYINSPETPIYTKGEHLYGIYQARQAARRDGRVILCEGNIDVIMAWQAGFEGTVAAMGTALTPKQVRLVKRLSESVVCVMDGDAAGQKATFASLLAFLEEGLSPRAVALPAGDDPDSFLRTQGKPAFSALLDGATPLLAAHVRHVAAAHPKDPTGQAAALRAVAPALARVQDALERSLYLGMTATEIGVETGLVEQAIAHAAQVASGQSAPRSRPGTRPPAPSQAPSHRPAPPDDARPSRRPEPGEPGPAPSPPREHDGPPPAPDHDGPPPWFDGPEPGADPPPPPGSSTDPGFGDTEARRRPPPARQKKTALRPPALEVQVAGFICEFPHMVRDVRRLAGFESLTDEHLRAFFARLCDVVDRGESPSSEHLIVQLALLDPQLQAEVEPLIVSGPDRSPDDASEALAQACRQLRLAWLKRRRTELGAALVEAGRRGDPGGIAHHQRALNGVADELRRLLAVRPNLS
jgi:DNA primase